jgi:S1-C subfamily serine protease
VSGILSSKNRRSAPEGKEPLDIPDWLQTDASINRATAAAR